MNKMGAGRKGAARISQKRVRHSRQAAPRLSSIHPNAMTWVQIVELVLIIGLTVLAVQLTKPPSRGPAQLKTSSSDIADQQTDAGWGSVTDPESDNAVRHSQSTVVSSLSSQKSSSIDETPNSGSPSSQQQLVQPLSVTGWQIYSEGVDQCAETSQSSRIYCAPGKTATWYLDTTNGATIKSYYEVNGLDQGAMSGVTISYQLMSSSRLKVQLTSNQAHDPFGAYVMIIVNEPTSSQQKSHFVGWFRYESFCTTNPPHSGCAQ